MAEQLAFPGMGPNKQLQSPRSELPSRALSKLQFGFKPVSRTSVAGFPKHFEPYWGGARNEVYAIDRTKPVSPSADDAVGYLGWSSVRGLNFEDEELKHHTGGEVMMVETHKDYQRQGVATHMWNFAHEQVAKYNPDPMPNRNLSPRLFRLPRRQYTGNKYDDPSNNMIPPRHSGNRTSAGNAWAQAVGGELPERHGTGKASG